MTAVPPPVDGPPVHGPPAPDRHEPPGRRGIGRLPVVAVVLAVALLAGGVVALTHGRTEQQEAGRELARARQARTAARAVLARAERDIAAAQLAVADFGGSAQAATAATAHVVDLEATVVDELARLRAAGEATDIGTYNDLVGRLQTSSDALVDAFNALELPFRDFSDAIEVLPSAHCSAAAATTLRWKPYGRDGLQCARLRVPLDYSRPTGTSIEVTVVRRPADDRANLGPLFINPGGPGISAISGLRDSIILLPPEVLQKFDLVAVDPRGVGQSTPIDCADDLGPLFDPQLAGVSTAARDDAVERVARLVAQCRDRSGPILDHVDTVSAARDMDRVRAALGAEQLSYLGYSYGTYLGTVYADLFPERLRAAILDGAVDPREPSDVDISAEAQSFRDALDLALDDCGRRTECPFHAGGDAQGAYDRLLQRLETAPLAVDARRMGRTLAEIGVVEALYEGQAGWPRLMDALARAAAGDGHALLDQADAYTGRRPDGSYDDELEAHFAVACTDSPTQLTAAEARRQARDLGDRPARFDTVTLAFELPCAFWPAHTHEARPDLHARGAPPILVVNREGDPVTPMKSAEALVSALDRATLLRAPGSAHTSFGRGDDCIDETVVGYLISVSPPTLTSPCPAR
jgi:pimeloyl-ACP methyl ester carboxylesterase